MGSFVVGTLRAIKAGIAYYHSMQPNGELPVAPSAIARFIHSYQLLL
ncbi:hypothetical protein [Coleofasciculus chthonoplastes]